MWEVRQNVTSDWQQVNSSQATITKQPNTPTGVCVAMNGSSILSMRVTSALRTRDYRCYVRKDGVTYTQFSSMMSGQFSSLHRLDGLVVKTSGSKAEDPEFDSRLRRDFFPRIESYQLLKTGTPVASLQGAWRYRVSAGTGRPGVSIL